MVSYSKHVQGQVIMANANKYNHNINVLELEAVFLILKYFQIGLSG